MNEATTPAEGVPFALVDENGHLTGKPAEGVQAAIAEAVAQLPDGTWSQADFDEALKGHYAQIDNAFGRTSKAIRIALGQPTASLWGSAGEEIPKILRIALEAAYHARKQKPWASHFLGFLYEEYPDVASRVEEAMGEYTIPGSKYYDAILQDTTAGMEFIANMLIARQAFKVLGVDKLEVEGDNLRVTKDGRTGSVPITWDAA